MKHATVFALLLSTACATGRGVQDVPQDPPRPGSAAKVPPAQEPFEVPSYAELMGTRRKKPGQGAWGDR